MMITLKRTNSDNLDFRKLVIELDADLKIRDGEDHLFYSQFNKIDKIKYVVVAYEKEGTPIGCGAIKEYSANTMEIKRMFVLPDRRRHGIASAILNELEKWAIDLDFEKCLLETGTKQPEAIRLYQKNGYRIIQNYGQYENVESSICFMKNLTNCGAGGSGIFNHDFGSEEGYLKKAYLVLERYSEEFGVDLEELEQII